MSETVAHLDEYGYRDKEVRDWTIRAIDALDDVWLAWVRGKLKS